MTVLEAGIDIDPEVCSGRPVLAGTRFPVHNLVSYLRLCDGDVGCLLADYPTLSRGQVDAALAYYRQHTAEIEALIDAMHADYERGIAAQRARSGR